MNAIEQMMQSQGANTSQSMAAILGTSKTGNSSNVFAEQFAAALQGTEAASPFAQAVSNGDIKIYAVTGAEAAQASAEEIAKLTTLKATADASSNQEAIIQAAGQQTPEGLQLVKVTPENFAALFGLNEAASQSGPSASTQTTVGANEAELTGAQFLIIQTPNTTTQQDIHVLPMAELEALVAPQLAATQSLEGTTIASTQPASTGTATAPSNAAATATSANTIASSTNTLTATSTEASTEAGTAKPADTTAAPLSQGKAESMIEQASSKTTGEKAGDLTATKSVSVKEQLLAAEAKTQKATEADPHGVQNQQVANAAKKAASNGANTATQQNTAASNPALSAAAGQSATNNQSGEQKQSRQDDTKTAPILAAKMSAGNAPQTPALPQTPTLSWTPERLSGAGEGFSPDAFSGGLSGLRGESSFLSSMGLLGGKASPHMGGQIAKQLNLQVTNAVKNGSNEFTMRLDPAELGRVQVKMQFGADGKVAAQVMVERPETLELLQREVRGLERAIEAGGHKADSGGISFSLDTSDGESAGKAFAEAMHKDRLEEQAGQNGQDGTSDQGDANTNLQEQTDSAMLEEILSRVTPETGLDVRI